MAKLGVIGAGHMGMAILDGAVKTGVLRPAEIEVYDISPTQREAARGKGYGLAESERAAYENKDVLLLAVLPQNAQALLERLSQWYPARKPVVVSVVSGMSSAFIRRHLGADVPVVNVAPNLTMAVGRGATVMAKTDDVPGHIFSRVKRVFKELGEVALTEEKWLAEIIPANGCAPGYAFYMIDAVASAAAEQGVDYGLAVKMAAAAFAGAAQMLLAGSGTPPELLAKVCSPGGLTAKGVDYFNEHHLFDIIKNGAAESARRGHELALK